MDTGLLFTSDVLNYGFKTVFFFCITLCITLEQPATFQREGNQSQRWTHLHYENRAV